MKWVIVSTDLEGADLVPVDQVRSARVGRWGGALTLYMDGGLKHRVDKELISAAVEALGVGEALGRPDLLPASVGKELDLYLSDLRSQIGVGLFPSKDIETCTIAHVQRLERIMGRK